MKGLLIKDIHLMATQKNFFALVIVVALVVMMSSENTGFVIGYISFLFPLFTLSTISYDEFNNGYAFLFTLPVTRKEYAMEKYVFGLSLGGISWFVATLVTWIYQLVNVSDFNSAEWFLTAGYMISIMVLVLAIMIPLVLKFGGDKARIAAMIFVGAFIAIAFIANAIFNTASLNVKEGLNKILSVINNGTGIGIMFVALIVILLISIRISIGIMKKKEF